MEEENQLPLKRVELSLSKFNDVAIPHHLDLLRQHKANIIKYEESGCMPRVRAEAAGARRAAGRLRALLGELAALRGRVRDADRAAFDARTQRSRDLTLQAIMDYLGLVERSCTALARAAPRGPPAAAAAAALGLESAPMSMTRGRDEGAGAAATAVCGSAVSTDSVGVVAHAHAGEGEGEGQDGEDDDCDVPLRLLQIDDRELALSEREAALRSWTALQGELRELHDMWAGMAAAAATQRGLLAGAAGHVDAAAGHVQAARAHLSAADKLRAGAMGAGGAVLGALAGGPLGLVAGAKAGVAAALAGSLLGYCGARLLGRRALPALPALPALAPADRVDDPVADHGEDKKTQ